MILNLRKILYIPNIDHINEVKDNHNHYRLNYPLNKLKELHEKLSLLTIFWRSSSFWFGINNIIFSIF